MTLCLVPEILNNIDMILLVCKEFRIVDADKCCSTSGRRPRHKNSISRSCFALLGLPFLILSMITPQGWYLGQFIVY